MLKFQKLYSFYKITSMINKQTNKRTGRQAERYTERERDGLMIMNTVHILLLLLFLLSELVNVVGWLDNDSVSSLTLRHRHRHRMNPLQRSPRYLQ